MAYKRTGINQVYDRYGAQSPIPSQKPSNLVPYSNVYQPDVAQFAKLRGRKPHGFAPRGSYVVPNYDSRPVNEFDTWITEQNFDDGINFDNLVGLPNQMFYRVPRGRTLIIRQVGFTLYRAENQVEGGGFFTVFGNPFAFRNPGLVWSIVIDGSNTDGFTRVPVRDVLQSTLRFETFITVNQNSLVELRLDGNLANVDNTEWSPYILGDLLLATGRNLPEEVGSEEPIPVRTTHVRQIGASR